MGEHIQRAELTGEKHLYTIAIDDKQYHVIDKKGNGTIDAVYGDNGQVPDERVVGVVTRLVDAFRAELPNSLERLRQDLPNFTPGKSVLICTKKPGPSACRPHTARVTQSGSNWTVDASSDGRIDRVHFFTKAGVEVDLTAIESSYCMMGDQFKKPLYSGESSDTVDHTAAGVARYLGIINRPAATKTY